MRTYGRTYNQAGVPTWQVVTTDANGFNSAVMLTTLVQNLKLNLGESPFYANNGIPAHPSVIQQVYPDYYVALTQQRFSGYFSSLTVSVQPQQPGAKPVYAINVITQQGTVVQAEVAT